jgi:hypothetical protein
LELRDAFELNIDVSPEGIDELRSLINNLNHAIKF